MMIQQVVCKPFFIRLRDKPNDDEQAHTHTRVHQPSKSVSRRMGKTNAMVKREITFYGCMQHIKVFSNFLYEGVK